MEIITEETKAKQTKKFKKLDIEWRNATQTRKPEELKQLIADTAISLVVLALTKAADPDLASLRQKLATSNKYYTEGNSRKNIEIEFAMECLRSQGIPVEGLDDIVKAAKEKFKGDGGLAAEVKNAAKKLRESVGPGGSVTIKGPNGSVTVGGSAK